MTSFLRRQLLAAIVGGAALTLAAPAALPAFAEGVDSESSDTNSDDGPNHDANDDGGVSGGDGSNHDANDDGPNHDANDDMKPDSDDPLTRALKKLLK
jgi:hypothetical protein